MAARKPVGLRDVVEIVTPPNQGKTSDVTAFVWTIATIHAWEAHVSRETSGLIARSGLREIPPSRALNTKKIVV